ncbi:MAG: type II toxin-antitoxin system Phd/YefM family antitoxin [Treponema sp.]|nr:type II toxin-antitoxin system Phd/YefM family antitoxin [Treponema sp.]
MNTVPVFEAKNKLPLFIHQAEQGNPLAITRHNNVVAYLISKEDFEEFASGGKKEKSLVERIHDSRAEYGLDDDDDFDYTEYFDSLRDRNYFGRPGAEHIFDEV